MCFPLFNLLSMQVLRQNSKVCVDLTVQINFRIDSLWFSQFWSLIIAFKLTICHICLLHGVCWELSENICLLLTLSGVPWLERDGNIFIVHSNFDIDLLNFRLFFKWKVLGFTINLFVISTVVIKYLLRQTKIGYWTSNGDLNWQEDTTIYFICKNLNTNIKTNRIMICMFADIAIFSHINKVLSMKYNRKIPFVP